MDNYEIKAGGLKFLICYCETHDTNLEGNAIEQRGHD